MPKRRKRRSSYKVVNPDGSYASGRKVGHLNCVCGHSWRSHAEMPVGCARTQGAPCDCKFYRPDFSPEWAVPGKVSMLGLER